MTIRTVARSTDLYTAVLNIVCYHWFAIYSCLSGITTRVRAGRLSGGPGLGSIMPEAELLKLMICFYVKSTRSKVHIQSAYLIGHLNQGQEDGVPSAWPCLVRTAINHLITYIYYCLTFYFQTSCK